MSAEPGLSAVSWTTTVSGTSNPESPNRAAGAAQVGKPGDARAISQARQDFTALVLQSFLEAAVPKNLTGSQSPGAAAGMWRSLLVEQLAKSVAASGQFDVFGDVVDQRLVEPSAAPAAPVRRGGNTE